MTSLFSPVQIGAVTAANRILMAPLTRQRAGQPGDVPTELNATYYQQRASAGMIITEGTQISAEGKGYADAPGIHSPEQVAGWRAVTDAVHEAGGTIALQLWHCGRVNHPDLHGGELPVSASAVEFTARTSLKDEHGSVVRVDCPIPRALATAELPRVVADYAAATRNARAAGFDAVELHAAHGYFLHQFLAVESNQRTDEYGGSRENRARLVLEVLDAVIAEWSADRVGIRLSPIGTFNGLSDDNADDMAQYLAAELEQRDIGFLHLSEPDWAGGPKLSEEFRQELRTTYHGTIIGAGNYSVEKAQGLIEAGLIDAAAFGRPFIANPDLPARLAQGAALNEPDPATFYGGDARGYVDYPAIRTSA